MHFESFLAEGRLNLLAKHKQVVSPNEGPVKWLIVIIAVCFLALGTWPSLAIAPQVQILIDSGSPYFVPASANVATQTPIRWENPTPTQHTITHNGCLEDESPCAFDSDIIEPNSSYTVHGLPPGRYPYHCRLHPIMRGILIVTEQSVPSQL
jgi:plastocyanin